MRSNKAEILRTLLDEGLVDPGDEGALNTNPLSQVVTNQEQFLAQPHHG
jgi:hypothetical protein